MSDVTSQLVGMGCMGIALSGPYCNLLIRQAQEWTELEILADHLHIERKELVAGFHAFPGNLREYRRYILATGKLPNA